jgi:hypothetical protein
MYIIISTSCVSRLDIQISINIHICIYIYTYTYMYTYIHTYIYILYIIIRTNPILLVSVGWKIPRELVRPIKYKYINVY